MDRSDCGVPVMPGNGVPAARHLPLRNATCFLLAICVFLWGFGYKLSLYDPGPHSAYSSNIAKLWIDSKSSRVEQTPHHAATPQGELAALAAAFAFPVISSSHRIELVPVKSAIAKGIPRQLPSRAPPTSL